MPDIHCIYTISFSYTLYPIYTIHYTLYTLGFNVPTEVIGGNHDLEGTKLYTHTLIHSYTNTPHSIHYTLMTLTIYTLPNTHDHIHTTIYTLP